MKLTLTTIRDVLRNRSTLVDLLAILFGISAVLGQNANFVQLPLLVLNAPEGLLLPSHLVVVSQFGNLGPLLYLALQKLTACKDSYLIYGLLVLNMVSTVCMAFWYDQTAYLFGENRSVVMLVCFLTASLVSCTSPVLFMPYMGRFRDVYMVSYLIGEGFSGFIPSVVALGQGVGGNEECIWNNSSDSGAPEFISYTPPPRFSSTVYFLLVFIFLGVCTVAFGILDKHPRSRAEYAQVTVNDGNDYTYEQPKQQPNAELNEPSKKVLSQRSYHYLLVFLGIIFMIGGGFAPSVMPFSCLPYGNEVYHLSTALVLIANPVVAFLAMFLQTRSVRMMQVLAVISLIFSTYTMITALMRPQPPLVGTTIGNVLVVSLSNASSRRILNAYSSDCQLGWFGSIAELRSRCSRYRAARSRRQSSGLGWSFYSVWNADRLYRVFFDGELYRAFPGR